MSSAHTPPSIGSVDNVKYFLATGGRSTLSENKFNAMTALAIENVDLTSLWGRFTVIEKHFISSPHVIVLEVDPLVPAASEMDEDAFQFSAGQSARPKTVDAVDKMIEVGKSMGCLAYPEHPKGLADVVVSRFAFVVDGDDAEASALYDKYADACHAIEVAESASPDDPERDEALRRKIVEKNVAMSLWEKKQTAALLSAPHGDLLVRYRRECWPFDQLFGKGASAADRLAFLGACMNSEQHAVILVYRGDTNLRKAPSNYVHASAQYSHIAANWMRGRRDTVLKLEKAAENIRGADADMDPQQWKMPARVNDTFVFSVPCGAGVDDFFKQVINMRISFNMIVQEGLQMVEQDKEQ